MSRSLSFTKQKELPGLENQLFQDSTDPILASKMIVTYMILHLLTRLNLVKN